MESEPGIALRMRAALAKVSAVHWLLVATVIAGAALRIFWNDVPRYSSADEGHYVGATKALVEGGPLAYVDLVKSYLARPEEWPYPTPVRWGYLGMTALTCAVRAPCDARALAWLSTLAGTLSIVLTFFLGARLVGKRAALVAAALTLTSPLQLALGRRALQDEVYCAVVLLAFWSLVRLVEHDGARRDGAGSLENEAISSRVPIGKLAAFIGASTLAFAIKESFAFPYAALVAVYVLAPRGRRLAPWDALVIAAPPALFFAGFVALSRSPHAFFELLAIGQASFLGDYSVKYQSGPPHRPLFDLFTLAPLVSLVAVGALARIVSRSTVRDARRGRTSGGERWLALFLVFALAAFMGLPKNVRFVVILDPILRLLAAWTLVRHFVDERRAGARWALSLGFVVAVNAAVELALFHTIFIENRTYDPVTHELLEALGAIPGPSLRAEPSSWPFLFFAAFGLALAALHLTRRSAVTQPESKDPEATKPEADSTSDETGDETNETATKESAGSEGEAGDAGSKPSAPDAAPAGNERAVTIAVAVVCVIAALFIGRAWGERTAATSAPGGSSSSAASTGDPAADEVNAGLAASDANEAVTHFRKALEITPTHYGASFQLARALDRAGRRDEAKKQWERVLKMAEQQGDQPLVDAARSRLGGGRADAPADPMAAGVEALYTKRDPATAVARFREVLAQNPDHYGATFQLATALDQTGDLRTSRQLWEKMAKMADAIQDAPTAETARARMADIDTKLGPPPAADPEAAAMSAAVEALYNKNDAKGAADQLRKILQRNPTHYGATFQLATALDRLGNKVEARVQWEKVAKMADAISDKGTADAARARLAQKP